MKNEQQPIVVNLPEGQDTITILQGEAPKQLDQQAPAKIDIKGVISAPLDFLEKRVKDIDQHKAHILVCRDRLQILLVINEDDAYTRGKVLGELSLSEVFLKLGINSGKTWVPAQLGQFLKLNRCFFPDLNENMKVVSALKSFTAKVNQDVARETNERGNRTFQFVQAVNSNIPERFRLLLPIFSGGESAEIEVETYATVDGTNVTVSLQSAGANDIIEDAKATAISDVIEKICSVAPEIAIIEQ